MKIKFSNVGRDKKSWEDEIPCDDELLDERQMIKSIKKHKALGSNGIEIADDGNIYVGGFRCVGTWEIAK